jgi:serine/threonine protein kinase/tetratricopeptide (TPR) repeat protein
MAAADRNLLFGLLALQNGLIDQVQLVAAFQAWTRDKQRDLADHLLSRGALDADQRAIVEALVALHLKKHGGTEASLAAIPAGRSTRESLARLGDPEIDRTLTHLTSGSDGDADRTATFAVGTVTSEGQRFRVLRPHARGGLGAVFVALDEELHREVALKQILEKHADDPGSRARFLLEAEITGGLEHPGIVPVYGLGTYADGRPFYAMRFIRGDSLKEAIDRFHRLAGAPSPPADEGRGISAGEAGAGSRDLRLRKLLRRFVDVCYAIEYAHSRGVLHRDIKPGNVIVGRHGETLVLDWGLAKATGRADPSSGERTLSPPSASGSAETLPGSALGTPGYMSPEQAGGSPEQLGPRSDVYSLGATLYCLLTGRPPFAGEVADVLAAVRRGEFRPPRAIDPTVDRALEAVCLKAMALEPGHRHGSCRALAEDIERWMADESVAAWREPWARRARRWARRHRTALAAAVVALVAGVVGLGAVAAVQARANGRLRDANAATSGALADTRQAQAETRAALARSEESRQQAEAVSTFLVEAFRSPDPSQDGRQVKVADVLDRAGARLEREFAGSRATQGALLDAVGQTYRGLGLYNRAAELHARAAAVREAALGPDHPDTLRSHHNRAVADLAAGRLHEAIALHEATLRRRESKLGPDHPDTLKSRHNLAIAYGTAGRQPEAIALYESTLKLLESRLGPDHPDTLSTRGNLAVAYWRAARHSEAIALHQATLARSASKLGPDHPYTLATRSNVASSYLQAGRSAEAIAQFEVTLARREARLGPQHRQTLLSRNALAVAHESLGRWAEAERLRRETLARRRRTVGSDSPLLADDLAPLGRNLLGQSRYSEAEPPLREALAIHEAARRDDWSRYDTLSLLGGALLGQGRHAEAEPLIVAGYEGMKAREGRIGAWDRSRVREAAERIVRLYEGWGRPDQAMAWKMKLGMPDLPADIFAAP